MTDYLFYSGNTFTHYFHKSVNGLCIKRGNAYARIIFPDCRGIFSVLRKSSGEDELLCLNDKNELIYYIPDTGHRHILTHISNDMEICVLMLFELSGKTHFIYSARYCGDILLVYSPLDNNALPKTLAKLKNPEFCLHKTSVYFTLQGGALGYIDLAGSDLTFNRLTDKADSVCLFTYNNTDLLIYKKGESLFFQNRPVCNDAYAESPIIFAEGNVLFIMWKSRGFILYKKSTDSGKTWSGTGRILAPCGEAVLAVADNGNTRTLRYVEALKSKPRLLGSTPKNGVLPAAPVAELNSLQAIIKNQADELEAVKKELAKLKSELHTF